MNETEFKVVMLRHGDTNAILAEYLGLATKTLILKIKGVLCFNQREIGMIKERYKLSPEELDMLFFATQVS